MKRGGRKCCCVMFFPSFDHATECISLMSLPSFFLCACVCVCVQAFWHSQEHRPTGIIHQPHVRVHPLISALQKSAASPSSSPNWKRNRQSSIPTVTSGSRRPSDLLTAAVFLASSICLRFELLARRTFRLLSEKTAPLKQTLRVLRPRGRCV